MFDRSLLKSNAKVALKRFYGTALIVLLIINAITGVANSFTPQARVEDIDTTELTQYIQEYAEEPSNENLAEMMEEYQEALEEANTSVAGGGVGSIFTIALAIFVANVLEVGKSYFYLRGREFPVSVDAVFNGFKKGYLKNVGTQFLRGLYTSLWSLLFVVPGIVKSYQYSMIPYILAENPNVTRKQAFQLSKELTDGYKWELFVLDLSFLGWQLLGLLCCGLGAFFLDPYISATKAEAYTFLKARAVESGKAQMSDFTGIEILDAPQTV